jgi:hypothetical protein
MKSINQYIKESSDPNDYVEVENGVNTRKDPKHLELVRMFPESEGWNKVYREEYCYKNSSHGTYGIGVGHLNNGKYAVTYRIDDTDKQLKKIFNTLKDAREFIDTDLRKQFEESDDYFKNNYLKIWRN